MSLTGSPWAGIPRVAQAAAVLVLLAILIGVLAWTLGQRVVALQSGAPSLGSRTRGDQDLSAAAFESLAQRLTESARRAHAESAVAPDQDELVRQGKIALRMALPSSEAAVEYPHIKYFRDAGIRRYAGPRTCLECHRTLVVRGERGERSNRDTLNDVTASAHYVGAAAVESPQLQGFDGRPLPVGAEANGIPPLAEPPCGVPGGRPWEPWALVPSRDPEGLTGQPRGPGCGQWHIGGHAEHPTLGKVSKGRATQTAEDGIDCLICHAASYDLDQRRVLGEVDRARWGQDRSLAAALTVGRVSSEACQRCHGATDQNGQTRLRYPAFNLRIPYDSERDLHSAAGVECTDCHIPQGHRIPRRPALAASATTEASDQRQGSACEGCHSRAPHTASQESALLNGHVARITCETCHLGPAPDGGLVLLDWTYPTWVPGLGLYQPSEIYPVEGPGLDYAFLWFNAARTTLGTALGDNPEGGRLYDPFTSQLARLTDPTLSAALVSTARTLIQTHPEIDPEAYARQAAEPITQLGPEVLAERRTLIDTWLRPLMGEGTSRLHPFQLVNDRLPEEWAEAGPFGAPRAPFDARVYLERGDLAAALVEAKGRRVPHEPVPRWMPQMRTRAISHGIQREARGCRDCHAPGGILDYRLLGYSDTRAAELQDLDDLMRLPKDR